MKVDKRLIIIIGIVVFSAIIIQLIRSNFLMTKYANKNIEIENQNYKSIEIPKGLNIEKYIVIYDEKEPNSINIKNNILKTLEYMKKDIVVTEVGSFNKIDENSAAIIVCFERMDRIKNIDYLMDYAKRGGSLFFAERPLIDDTFKRNFHNLGINNYIGIVNTGGISLLTNVLIKGNGISLETGTLSNSSLNLSLKDETEVMAISKDDIPILWNTDLGQGHVIVFNGSCLNEKNNRGLIAGSISLLREDCIYPILNTKLSYIDDFPAPIPEGIDSNIYKEYGLNIAQFYRNIWWTDILSGAEKYNLKYTGTLIETYNNNTKYPFETNKKNDENVIVYGRELLRSGGEIGMHGYNHQSLALEGYIKQDLGYNSFESISDMEKSIFEVNDYAKSFFPKYTFRVYVPPSNILSNEGKTAIKNSMPDLKIISSLYNSHYLGDAYAQEFEIKDGIYNLPRITSGYNNDSDTNWNIYNGITSLGVFSHFIHPDDILDARRNENKNWETLNNDYSNLLENVNNNFPWLKAVTASQGAISLEKYVNIKPYTDYGKDQIKVYCQNFQGEVCFILRTKSQIHGTKDYDAVLIDDGVYLVNAKKPIFIIEKK